MAEHQRREMHSATCSECGEATQVPFFPTPGKPIYCRECHNTRKSTTSSRVDRPRFDATCSYCHSDFTLPFSPDPSRLIYCHSCKEQGNRLMFDVTCNNCLGDFQVPFEPDGSRPIYCNECKEERKANQYARGMGLSFPNSRRQNSVSHGLGMTTTRDDVWNTSLGHGIKVNKGGRRGPYGY